MDVSIVLVNYKTSDLTHDVVNSIFEKTKKVSFEVIIVDNSNDSSDFEKLLDLKGRATLINANGNLGFGKGNNLGAEKASGDFVLFLNTDTILLNDTISILYNEAIKANADIVGPNIYTKDLSPNISYEKKPKTVFCDTSFASMLLKRFSPNYYFNKTNKNLPISGYISGACLMIKRDAFIKLGGFNANIFMYAEESLLCYEAVTKLKTKILNVPKAKIIHLEGQSSSDSQKRIERFIDGNYLYYFYAFGEQKAVKYLKKSISLNRKKALLALFFKPKKRPYFKMCQNCFLNKYNSIKEDHLNE